MPNRFNTSTLIFFTISVAVAVMIWVFLTDILTPPGDSNLPETPVGIHDSANLIVSQANIISARDVAFQDKSSTYVLVPFKFTARTYPLWLTLEGEVGKIPEYSLLYHPYIQSLEKSSISRDGIYLYQATQTYDTFDEFLSNPPSSQSLVMDKYLFTDDVFGPLTDNFIDRQIDVSEFSYILTTATPLEDREGWYDYSDFWDLSGATVSTDGEIRFFLDATGASDEDSLMLAPIRIDYGRRP